jgi:hypothetical protein
LGYQICYVIAAVAAFGGSAAAAGIATVTDVVNEGYRTPPGHEERAARRADELVQHEALRTDDESSIRLRFVDGSELNVEAESALVLSEYVFDGSASAGLINLNGGLFHFTSNGQPDQGVKLKTPVATIGVRGTEFLVHVGRDTTIIDILSGAVEAQPSGTGKSIVCVGGESILVAGPDEDAVCGDLGSFSSAAGPGGHDGPEPGTRGGNNDKERPERPERPSRDNDNDDGGGDDGGSSEGGEGSSGGSGGITLFIDEDIVALG